MLTQKIAFTLAITLGALAHTPAFAQGFPSRWWCHSRPVVAPTPAHV